MQPGAHAQGKYRGKQCGQKIGDYFENLISGMEFWLQRAYREVGLDPVVDQRDTFDVAFISLRLLYDKEGTGIDQTRINDKGEEIRLLDELKQQVAEITRRSNGTTWTPNIRLPKK